MKLIISSDARADMMAIGAYIARDNPDRAQSFVADLLDHTSHIVEHPEGYRLRPEWGEQVRSAPYGNYQIIFETITEGVFILRIAHARRDIASLLKGDQ